MRDAITQAAISYGQLAKYRYDFVCGRKGNRITVSLVFPLSAFFHLAGFQYVKLDSVRNKNAAYGQSLLGEITDHQLRQKNFTHFDRLECIASLQRMIETNRFTFQIVTKNRPYTRIPADYFICEDDKYLFVKGDKPQSLFKNTSDTDYFFGTARYTILEIRRTHLADHKFDTIYVHATEGKEKSS